MKIIDLHTRPFSRDIDATLANKDTAYVTTAITREAAEAIVTAFRGAPKILFPETDSPADELKCKDLHYHIGNEKCDECPDVVRTASRESMLDKFPEPKAEPSLILLVIDLGNYCVVKVEKSDGIIPIEIGQGYRLCTANWPIVMPHSFADVRAAIDQLEDKPPEFPYIAFDDALTPPYALCLTSHGTSDLRFGRVDYDALTKLAGKPLPIYEPKRGTWVQLPEELIGATQHWANWVKEVLPCTIWRYCK